MTTTTAPFKPTIAWLRSFLAANGQPDLARRLPDDYCWREIGQAVRAGACPPEIVDAATAALIASGNGWACYKYCLSVKDRPDVRAAMIASRDGYACYKYCRLVKDRDDVRAAMIASGVGWACYEYCRNVQDRADVRAALIASGDRDACYRYCLNVQDRPEVWAVFERRRL